MDPGHARFERCTFVDTKIKDWFAFCAEFVECRFATRIVGCKFSGTPFQCQVERKRNEFHGNDFRDAELIDTSFVMGIDLSAQLLPEGDEYLYLDRIAERLERARALVQAWPDGEERHLALSELETLEFLAQGQSEILARRDAPPEGSARDRLWDALKAR